VIPLNVFILPNWISSEYDLLPHIDLPYASLPYELICYMSHFAIRLCRMAKCRTVNWLTWQNDYDKWAYGKPGNGETTSYWISEPYQVGKFWTLFVGKSQLWVKCRRKNS